MMQVNWVGEILRVRTATGEVAPPAAGEEGSGEAKEAGKEGKEAKEAKEETKEEERPRLRGLDLPEYNEKPVLVYFHWPHDDGDRGKRIVKFCSGPLDDEAFVLLSPLFHCVEVNTRDSETKLVAEAKVRTTPTLLVCSPDGTILWRSEDSRVSGKSLAVALRTILAREFPDRWAAVEKEMKFQADALKEARVLAGQKRWEDAAFALRQVVSSDVRFTKEWMEARKLLPEAEKKAEEEAAK